MSFLRHLQRPQLVCGVVDSAGPALNQTLMLLVSLQASPAGVKNPAEITTFCALCLLGVQRCHELFPKCKTRVNDLLCCCTTEAKINSLYVGA